jgi:Zn-dependent protease/CBS domain-containing protein
MEAQLKLGRIFGIQIGLHYSWLIIALLIVLSLATEFRDKNPEWGEGLIIGLAIATGVLFFVAIILHELAHSVVALARGLPVRSITLFALGGVAQIEKDAADAKTEFWMGIMGPIASALIGIVCLAGATLLGWVPMEPANTPVLAMLVWLGYINLVLAIFNMIPGFPLDGGRVLRAVLWWVTGNANRATRIAARVGQIVAFGFIVWGIVQFFGGAGFGGLWIAFIGWFLLEAARSSHAQVTMTELLKGVRVRDVMDQHCPTVDSRTNIQTLADEYLLRTGRRCFVVVENDRAVGLITAHQVKEIPRSRWPYTTVGDVMVSIEEVLTADPDTLVADALETMGRKNINQLPVIVEGRLEGVISREHVVQLLQARSELHM